MKTDLVVSNNEIEFVLKALEEDLRVDGRPPFEMRPLDIKFHKEGTAEVQVGKTRVVAVVSAELVVPFPDRPSEGSFNVNVELSPMASPSFEAGRPGEDAVELAKALERGFKDSGAVDLEALTVLAGRAVWAVRLDVHVVDHAGSLAGAASLGALAALLSHRRPEVSVQPDSGAITVHPVEVKEAIPLALHHLPVAAEFALLGEDGRFVVIDPLIVEEAAAGGTIAVTVNQHREVCAVHKAGGVAVPPAQLLRCIRIAATHAGEMVARLRKAEAAHRQAAVQARIRRKRAPGAAVVVARPVSVEVSTLGEANAAAAAALALGGGGGGDADMEEGGGEEDEEEELQLEAPVAAEGEEGEDDWDMVDADTAPSGGGSLLRMGPQGGDGSGGGGGGGEKKKKAQRRGGGGAGGGGEDMEEFDRVAKQLMGGGGGGGEARDAKRGKQAEEQREQGPPPTSLLDAVKSKQKKK